ncbi:MAG: hypothetical protein Q4A75_00155 [Peptostreptococcaceae bacterium]|nr:hypothetical protein [Peptostreptococcaceae bacterium]
MEKKYRVFLLASIAGLIVLTFLVKAFTQSEPGDIIGGADAPTQIVLRSTIPPAGWLAFGVLVLGTGYRIKRKNK